MNNLLNRLSSEEAIHLFHSMDFYEIGERAHHLRLQKTDPKIVSYVVDRNINYTNVCSAHCKFCAFSCDEGDSQAYVLTEEELFSKIEALVQAGGDASFIARWFTSSSAFFHVLRYAFED